MCKMLHECFRFPKPIESLPLLFQVTCLIGLSWQLFEISSEYLKYKVSCRTTVFIPVEVEDLSMGICLQVAFVIDYNKFHTDLQYNWTRKEFWNKRMLDNLSIHEIYNYTYDADNILYNSGYWKNEWDSIGKLNNFSSIFKMKKYFFDSKMCYLYSIKSFNPLSVQWIRGGSIVWLDFGKELSEMYAVWLFIAEKGRIPFSETVEARYTFRGNSMKVDNFQSSHYSIRKELLPPPYETDCFSYSKLNFTNRIECIERCFVLKSFQKWGRISNVSLVPNNADDYKFVIISNYTKYRTELDEIRLFCQSSCPNTSCEDTHIVTVQETATYLSLSNLYKENISISWQRKTPSIPSATILCRSTSTLVELILYMMSSVSTWTGLSMMSINPILFLRSLSKIKWTSGISTIELCRHRKITPINHTDRISRLENCLVLQSLEIEKLRQTVFRPVNNRRKSAKY